MTRREWLDSLKAGDPVIITGSPACITKVKRTTKTLIITERTHCAGRFGRKRGSLVGDLFSPFTLQEPTQERLAEIQRHHLVYKLQYDYRWGNLPLATLIEIDELLPKDTNR